jgi:hypothetical protein
MTDYKQLCNALEQAANELDFAENALSCSSYHNAAQRAKQAAHAARAALAQLEPQRLTVQQINDLPQHRGNFIYSDSNWPGVIKLDGTFSRTDLQQLADSIPVS